MPPFWLGLVLIVFFAINLLWLPSLGMYSSRGPGGLGDLLLHLFHARGRHAAAPGGDHGAGHPRLACWRSSARIHQVARSKGLSERAVLGLTPSGWRGRPSSPSPACSSATCWAAGLHRGSVRLAGPRQAARLLRDRPRREGGPGRRPVHRGHVRAREPGGGSPEPLPRPARAAGLATVSTAALAVDRSPAPAGARGRSPSSPAASVGIARPCWASSSSRSSAGPRWPRRSSARGTR